MAGVTTTALRRLLPNSRAWALSGQADQVIQGLGETLNRPREFLRGIQDESRPATATATIDEWIAMLGIVVPSDATLADKRKIAADAIAAIGGQSLDYINERIRAVFPNVYIEETDAAESGTAGVGECGVAECEEGVAFTFFYYVRGFYPFARDFIRLKSILQRTAPLHLSPVYEARSVYDGDVARCGIGSTGRAICGRRETAYKPTDGQVARTGVGVAGVAHTGRIPE